MLDALRKLQADGLVSCQRHPHAPLTIWNYTARCQYSRAWTPETLAARGLILHDDGSVVARGFVKFFNLGEHQGPLPDEPFRVFDKVDGSLGILYFVDGEPAIATRGSFASDQAVRATAMFRERYADYLPPPGFTAVFEIVYPANRIVVDYGHREDLFHLGLVSNETGLPKLLLDHGWRGPQAEVFEPMPPHALAKLVKPNAEGFVVRYAGGFQVKVKLEEYVRIHRLMFQTSTRSIWEHLAAGGNMDGILAEVPDEVFDFVREQGGKLLLAFNAIENEAKDWFKSIRGANGRKAFAEEAKKYHYPSILFAMFDDKPYQHMIWKLIEPEWLPAKAAPLEAVA